MQNCRRTTLKVVGHELAIVLVIGEEEDGTLTMQVEVCELRIEVAALADAVQPFLEKITWDLRYSCWCLGASALGAQVADDKADENFPVMVQSWIWGTEPKKQRGILKRLGRLDRVLLANLVNVAQKGETQRDPANTQGFSVF